jgi:hypothetical protein
MAGSLTLNKSSGSIKRLAYAFKTALTVAPVFGSIFKKVSSLGLGNIYYVLFKSK